MNQEIHIVGPNEILIEAKPTQQVNLQVQGGSGTPGKSAYQLWIEEGNQGTVQDYLNTLKGETGEGVAPGGNTGALLQKASSSDYHTEWVDVPDLVLIYNNKIL